MKRINIYYKILIVSILIFISISAFRIIIGGDEDTWICENGQWIKHGNPTKPIPAQVCRGVINNFDDCIAAGNVVMESYPRQCRDRNGEIYTEYIGNELEKNDLIQLDMPRPNEIITTGAVINGRARGFWFFEATFPVALLDSNGNEIVSTYAQAEGEWMTENFVDFKTILNFPPPSTGSGLLILKKDNPSGLNENEDSLIVPVKFN